MKVKWKYLFVIVGLLLVGCSKTIQDPEVSTGALITSSGSEVTVPQEEVVVPVEIIPQVEVSTEVLDIKDWYSAQSGSLDLTREITLQWGVIDSLWNPLATAEIRFWKYQKWKFVVIDSTQVDKESQYVFTFVAQDGDSFIDLEVKNVITRIYFLTASSNKADYDSDIDGINTYIFANVVSDGNAYIAWADIILPWEEQ